MCVCLWLLVDWYCGFSAVAAWYGHVILDRAQCTLGRPASHDYATRSDFMLIGSLSLLLPSSSSPRLFLLLSTFVFASLLFLICFLIWVHINLSVETRKLMWPAKINRIDQTKLPNCWQVSIFFFCLLWSCEVDECCPLVVKKRHIQMLLYSNPIHFLSKVKPVMLVLRVVAHKPLHVF